MKVLIAPDLHLDITGEQRLAPLVEEKADYLIIAGDLCSFDLWEQALGVVRDRFKRTKVAIIPGNHDFWTHKPQRDVAQVILLQRRACKRLGVHYLPNENLKIGSTTFVGSCLWYDYSFASLNGNMGYGIGKPWDQKVLVSGKDPMGGQWQDMTFIHKKLTDPQLADKLLKQFEKRVKQAEGSVIAVTHMLPHKQLNAHPDWHLYNAYTGCARAGELLDTLGDRLLHAFCGHTHKRASFGRYTNIGNDYNGPLLYAKLEVD